MNKNLIFCCILISTYLFGNIELTDEMKNQILKNRDLNTTTIKDSIQTPNNIKPITKIENAIIPVPKKVSLSNKYYGYNYFLQRESLSLYENLPLSSTYQLGPGDEIIINIWGNVELQLSYTINREGNVFIDKLGQLSIIGKTLSQAEDYLKKRFETIYSTMKNPAPTTHFSLSIGKLKLININIIGETKSPGIHSLHPFSTITTALIQSGGVENTGSLRSIKLIRNEDEIVQMDFYNFLLRGKTTNDIHLKDGDIIFIPLRQSEIKISGEINRESTFELIRGETLKDLLNYCGGLKINAQNTIELNRIIDIENREHEDYAKKTIYIETLDLDYELKNGDDLNVKSIHDVEEYVKIFGVVKVPGKYSFVPEMTILDVLKSAGGIHDINFIKTMNLENIEVVRLNENNEFPIIINVNGTEILNGNKNANIKLQNWDEINVRGNNNYKRASTVLIKGEINNPGQYALYNKNESLQDLIKRAGGITNRANIEGIKIFRNNKQIILNNNNFHLQNNDEVLIPQFTSVVLVEGEVNHSGYVQYIEGKKLDYYIKRAGGFSINANKNNMFIIYPNGDIKSKSLFRSVTIKEGSKIIVQTKEEKEDLNITEFLKELASILASLATIIYIVNTGGG